ncbi:MAG: hypothetical protein MUC42_11150, partial [Bryobacter sp.]|nr:hypothetical protein [Bryobacter sp.]
MISAALKPVDRAFEGAVLGLAAAATLGLAATGTLGVVELAPLAAAFASRFFRWRLPSLWANLIALAVLASIPLQWGDFAADFVGGTVRLLVVLLVLKLASARTERDWMQVQVLAFLEVLAASVLSTSASYFAFLAVFLVFAVAAFALAEILRSARQPRRIIRHGLDRFGRRLAALT